MFFYVRVPLHSLSGHGVMVLRLLYWTNDNTMCTPISRKSTILQKLHISLKHKSRLFYNLQKKFKLQICKHFLKFFIEITLHVWNLTYWLVGSFENKIIMNSYFYTSRWPAMQKFCILPKHFALISFMHRTNFYTI